MQHYISVIICIYLLKHNVAYQELYRTALKLIIRYCCWLMVIISLFRHCYRFFMFSCDLIPALTVFSKFLGNFPSCANSLLENTNKQNSLERNIDSFSIKCVKWEISAVRYKENKFILGSDLRPKLMHE